MTPGPPARRSAPPAPVAALEAMLHDQHDPDTVCMPNIIRWLLGRGKIASEIQNAAEHRPSHR